MTQRDRDIPEYKGEPDPFWDNIFEGHLSKADPEQVLDGMELVRNIAETHLPLTGRTVRTVNRRLAKLMPDVKEDVNTFTLTAMLNVYSADKSFWTKVLGPVNPTIALIQQR